MREQHGPAIASGLVGGFAALDDEIRVIAGERLGDCLCKHRTLHIQHDPIHIYHAPLARLFCQFSFLTNLSVAFFRGDFPLLLDRVHNKLEKSAPQFMQRTFAYRRGSLSFLRQIRNHLGIADRQSQLKLIFQVRFLEHIGDMVLHCSHLHSHGLGNFSIGQSPNQIS